MTTIALLPGDGIGREILDGPVAYLRQLERRGLPVRISGPWPYGSTGWRETGATLPPQTIEACRTADVVLSGAVGTHPGISAEDCPNPEAALIALRHEFDLRISVRTVRVPGRADVIIVRNITGGAYAGPDHRVESDGVRAAEEVKFESVNVDRAAYELVRNEELPAVIVTEGLFGDILSDIVCARAGSPALCGSATINPDRVFGHGITALFEPAHGSSPHRTGTRRSNPTGAWLALADLLAWCPDLAALGLHATVRRALDEVIRDQPPTYDLARPGQETIGLDQFNELVLKELL
jgi:3-isopropylmalate dehydrogenase